MIARTASTGHVDANMLTIRNQYLQHYYEKAGDYRNAYKYLKRDYQLNDSIRSERIRTRVAELDMRYRQDTIVLRKEMQIQRQAGEVRVLRLSMYIWVLVCLLLAAGTVVIIWYMRKRESFSANVSFSRSIVSVWRTCGAGFLLISLSMCWDGRLISSMGRRK